MNVRALAACAIHQVRAGCSLTSVLPELLKKCLDARDQGLIQAITYGVCRWFYRLEKMISLLVKKPFKQKDDDIYCLLLVGIYQIIYLRIPERAAVSETVAAVRYFKKEWASRVVNAVLRQFIREREELIKIADQELVSRYSYPYWMISHLQFTYPDAWQDILVAGNDHPPFSLRVNKKHFTREDYLLKLPKSILHKIIPETESGIELAEPLDVNQLPGFLEGDISVQDGAAQLAASLLQLLPHQSVLDACAAPGGKTAHLLETEPSLDVVAVDVNSERMQRVNNNLSRLKLSAKCIIADASDLNQFWDGKPFDRILLDAPCSASGVIRRHPDIKLLRREEDLFELSERQLHLLEVVWKTLQLEGLLLYVTCSIFNEENVEVIKRFLMKYSDAKEDKIKANWGKECAIGRQILPGMHGMDGFYFARLRKMG